MPVIKASMSAKMCAALKETLWHKLLPDDRQLVVINRLLGVFETDTVAVVASAEFERSNPELLAAIHEIVSGVTRVGFEAAPRPDTALVAYYATKELFSSASKILVEANIEYEAVSVPCEVTDLLGNPAWYAAAYCSNDDKLKKIENTLHGRVLDLELYYSTGMVFRPLTA